MGRFRKIILIISIIMVLLCVGSLAKYIIETIDNGKLCEDICNKEDMTYYKLTNGMKYCWCIDWNDYGNKYKVPLVK